MGLAHILILVSDLSSTQKLQAFLLHPPAECQDAKSSSNGFESSDLGLESSHGSDWLHDLKSLCPSDLNFLSCKMGI